MWKRCVTLPVHLCARLDGWEPHTFHFLRESEPFSPESYHNCFVFSENGSNVPQAPTPKTCTSFSGGQLWQRCGCTPRRLKRRWPRQSSTTAGSRAPSISFGNLSRSRQNPERTPPIPPTAKPYTSFSGGQMRERCGCTGVGFAPPSHSLNPSTYLFR